MYNPLLLPELREMLSTGDEKGLSEVMTELHPATIADFSEGLSVEETWRLLDYASSPFVATFVDVTGIVIYFSIAKAYLL